MAHAGKSNGILRRVTSRLVLWYASLFVVSSVGVFSIVYLMLRSSLLRRVDETLVDDTEEFEAIYRKGGVEALRADFVIEAESEGLDRVFFRLLSPDMGLLASSDLDRWAGLDEVRIVPPAPGGNGGTFATVTLPGPGSRVRVIARQIGDGDILQVGYRLEEEGRLMEKLVQTFGLVIASLMVCGVAVAWFLTRRAMSGVERVTQTAMRIAGGDLAHRVPVGNEGQEIDDLAKAFNDMLERIQALVSEMKEVINNIAHDLRSPIARIRGLAEANLTGGRSSDPEAGLAAAVIEESDRLVEMIDTMLEIAETESGIADLSVRSLDVAHVVRDAYELFLPVAEDGGIRLEIEVPPEPLVVRGDLSRLQRVMANLMDNALKYTERGGRVILAARGDRSHVSVSVADSGIGISEGDQERIFERFFRQDRSRSRHGNGLGLTLARAFVRAHGGDISVTSRPGTGSTFTVHLPRTPPQRLARR